MKRLLMLAIVLLSLGLIGCQVTSSQNSRLLAVAHSSAPTSSQTSSPLVPKKNIALVMKTLTNPFFVEMEKGARQAEQELGIHLIVKTGSQETSIAQQIAIVEELIQAHVDAIVIAPGSSTELIPVLKKAQGLGIPIINIDNRLDPVLSAKQGLVDVPFISVNNEQAAYQSAKYISAPITQPTEAIILEGIREAQNAEDRKQGALRAFAENKNIHVVAMETANWKIDEAYEVTARLFDQRPNIGVIFCANDMMALGTLKYLDDTGRRGVQVAAYDALAEAKKAIAEGKLAVTIDQQADRQGYLGVQFALRALNGEKLPLETLIDVQVVSASTLP